MFYQDPVSYLTDDSGMIDLPIEFAPPRKCTTSSQQGKIQHMDIEWQVVAMSLNQKWRIWMRIDGSLTAVQVQHVPTSAVCRYGYKWHYTDAQRESMLQRMLKRCNTYTDHIDYLFGREVQ